MHQGAAPVFLVSFRQRDELIAMTERCGWQAVGARRAAAAERRFIASGAGIAVIDGRGALDDALAVVRALADTAEANGAALVALVSRGDIARLGEVHGAGATHYLASPFGEAEFGQALRFAERHVDRLAGGHAAALRPRDPAPEPLMWRWRRGDRRIEISDGLARTLGAGAGEERLRAIARRLGRGGLRMAREAVAGLIERGETTAFAHDGTNSRIVHHLSIDDGIVSGRVEELAELAHDAATRDALTGLEDSKAAWRWIEHALRGGDAARPATLLLVSVSRFEMIAAAFGAEVGDALLRIAARRIERLALRGRRLIARLAGAEFVIGLPPGTTLEEARFLARSVVDTVCRPFVAGGHVVTLAAHAGLAQAGPGDDPAALLRRASAALAEAKADGGPIRLMSTAGEEEAAEANQLEIDLRQALAQDEIELLYQPQIAVTTGRIVGVEALARWRHPRLGELGAETLFAAAQRSDYLVQLSRHVQRQVAAEVARWPATLDHLHVAVNVTAPEMALPGFAEEFIALVDQAGLDRSRVTVEVTESGLIEDLTMAAALLATLRAAGLRVAIDDFGTGYSSLAYLKALPLDYLKIDKRLAQDIGGSARDRVVVRGVIDMARSLGLVVIAEGVETAEQLSLLAQEGCNLYQGFLSAPPLDLPALEAMVLSARPQAA